ncbi:MAG: hypothetical protein AAFV26_04640, partial [Pseudomonadota bacterium]
MAIGQTLRAANLQDTLWGQRSDTARPGPTWFWQGAALAAAVTLTAITVADLAKQAAEFDATMATLGQEAAAAVEAPKPDRDQERAQRTASAGAGAPHMMDAARAPAVWAIGGYSGSSLTLPSDVRFQNGEATDLTASDVPWIARPFKAPIYYGIRIQRWGSPGVGGMLDFLHDKAIADPDADVRIQGRRRGEEIDTTAKIGDYFSKLEFSHGHNMLTLNGLLRFGAAWARFRPYLGAGGGVSLPHTEVGFRGDNARTYTYQYAGLVGQALAGLEVQFGRVSFFFEYKFTYAPYDVPLTQEEGGLLVTDLWRQFKAWLAGEAPADGRVSTPLIGHHGHAGLLV